MVAALEPPKTLTTTADAADDKALALGRINLTADQLAQNLAGRSEDEVEALEWFREHCAARDLSYDQAALRLHKPNGSRYSRDTVYQAFTGRRGLEVSLAPLCESIATFRRNVESPLPVHGFLETRLGAVIRAHIKRAQRRQKIAMIVGQNASGKTTICEQLEREDPHVTKIHTPEGGHLASLIPAMGRRCGYGTRQTVRDLKERLIQDFKAEDILIFDEADQCFGARTEQLGNQTLDFIRRLREESHCTVVMVMDPAGYAKMNKMEMGSPLRRIFSRRLTLVLPAFFRDDLNLFARRYKLEPAPDRNLTVAFVGDSGAMIKHTANPLHVQDAVCSSHRDGLFQWLDILEDAHEDAQEQGRRLTWHAVLKAHALHAAMESMLPNTEGRK